MVWITRIDFAGFGNLSGEKIEFEERKLNLVLESDSIGKITVYGAVGATLFNLPVLKKVNQNEVTDRERFAPSAGSGLPYISGADLFIGSRYLKVIRDFGEDAVQVVDMSKNNLDVTSEFFTADGTDCVGLKITGMSRELFRRLAIVTSNEMSEGRVGRLADLAKTISDMLAERPFSLGVEQALTAIDEALKFIPHQGKRLRAVTVVRDLEGRYYELQDKVRNMERERRKSGLSVESSSALSQSFSGDEQGRLSEFFDLCMECADIDTRLVKSQETLVRVQELRSELDRIGSLDYFTLELQKQTEELFTRGQSRQQDFDSLVGEYSERIKEFDEMQKQLSARYLGLDVFSAADAQGINTLAKEYKMVSQDLIDYYQKRRNEIERLKSLDIDLPALDAMRKTLNSMSSQDYEDACSFNQQVLSARKQVDDCEEIFASKRQRIVQIDRERKVQAEKNKSRSLISAIVLVVGLCVTGGVYGFVQSTRWLWIDISLFVDLLSMVLSVLFAVRFRVPKYFKQKEYKAAQLDMNAQTRVINQLHQKILSLEVKFDALAHKVKFIDGREFMEKLKDYSDKVLQLKELDSIEKSIDTCEASLSHLKPGVEPYFARAGRLTMEIRPDTTSQLAAEINEYVEQANQLQSVYGPITAAKEQVEFLKTEISEIQKQLLANFIQARMEHLHDYKESHREFVGKVSLYQHWQATKNELRRLENDMSSGFVPDELPPQIARLESARKGKLMTMQELVNHSPSIVELAPPTRTILTQMFTVTAFSTKLPIVNLKRNIENLKGERDNLVALVRSANSSDASYVLMLQELRAVQSELTIVRRVKTALEHARDRIAQSQLTIAENAYVKLTEIMEDMLTQMGIETSQYEMALCDTTRGTDAAQFGSLIGKPFSLLTMEQVRWFARVVVARVLALNDSFPLLLNEPFGMDQEPLRENNLSFIFGLLGLHFQIFALTSDAARFEGAYSAASAEQKMLLHTCARVSLGT